MLKNKRLFIKVSFSLMLMPFIYVKKKTSSNEIKITQIPTNGVTWIVDYKDLQMLSQDNEIVFIGSGVSNLSCAIKLAKKYKKK